ncbi:PhoX family protein [Flavobacteriaceae bacterium XHP0103]|uniref:hypothetical protein n=1 Tax=Marixanthotalea marina TaxID=2844359 RepID=UPI002989D1DA|nr:hypothetical protein [Marixanthotalea marina]MBU3822583.1 PhoX family protein [Marixanthotalea marina]
MKKIQSIFLLVAAAILGSCDADKDLSEQDLTLANASAKKSEGGIVFENKSELTPLVNIFPEFNSVEAYSLISTTDVLGDFQMGGAADGAGLLKTKDGYIYVVNNEDNYAVSRIFLDESFTPYKGDYLLNSGVADLARQCSGTMWEKEIHGGGQDIFLSASESFHYDVKGIDPRVEVPTPTADFGLDALGEFSWENAVPLPKKAYNGSTVIIGGDDDSSGSQGQITLYYSKRGNSDLYGGDIYVLRLKEVSNGEGGVMQAQEGVIYDESYMDFGQSYAFEFVKIENGAEISVGEMEEACVAVNASAFMRVEDVDYQKGSDENGRNVFVAVTGRGPGRGTYNDWGTAYKLELDEDSPLSGKITQIISGNTDTNNMDGNLDMLQSPDNITVTENYVYLQEDPNSFSRGHQAYIYQTDLNGNNAKVVLELDLREELGGTSLNGEFGSLIDISDKVGVPDTFLLALQPHYWRSEDFKFLDNGDDATANPNCGGCREDNQGSQVVILKGLPR